MAKEYIKSKKELELEQKVSVPMIFASFIVPEIPDYYSVYPADFNGTPVACCPLHDEDTPSFRYYEDTNSFYCFGCGKGGSVVHLFRLFYNRMRDTSITHRDAVEFLYKYFIEGKELANLQSANKKDESLSTPVDMIRLNKYKVDVEQLISFDKKISLETKKKFWRVTDNLDLLISKNLISAPDALDYLKTNVNKLIRDEVRMGNGNIN